MNYRPELLRSETAHILEQMVSFSAHQIQRGWLTSAQMLSVGGWGGRVNTALMTTVSMWKENASLPIPMNMNRCLPQIGETQRHLNALRQRVYFPPDPIGVDLDFSKSMKSSRPHTFCITVLFSNGGLMAELGGWEG